MRLVKIKDKSQALGIARLKNHRDIEDLFALLRESKENARQITDTQSDMVEIYKAQGAIKIVTELLESFDTAHDIATSGGTKLPPVYD